MKRFLAASLALALTVGAGLVRAQNPGPGAPAAAPAVSEVKDIKDAVSGTMNIEFNTRTKLDDTGKLKDKSPAIGAKDVYTTDLTVVNFVQFTGEISRQPNLYTKIIKKIAQPAQLYYNLNVTVVNPNDPTQKRQVGKWVGTVPIDTASGAYMLSGGAASESPLRFDLDTVGSLRAYKENFEGKLIGKTEKKETLASYTFKRLLPNGQTAEIVVKKVDPMRFDGVVLPHGPSDVYPKTVVNGRLDYGYETYNYYTDGLKFSYTLNGQDFTDTVTGTIKWVPDKDYDTNGKGFYDFNLRWNEDKNKSNEAAAFEKLKGEDAFFAVDESVPALTGKIEYLDTLADKVVTASKVTYHLDAKHLQKHQVVAFIKAWLIAVGPTNDD
jgi:hypothetical protein